MTLLELRPERPAGHHGRTVPANPGSAMEFYWRNPDGEYCEFVYFLRCPPVLYFSQAAPFSGRVSFSVAAADTGLLMTYEHLQQVQRRDRQVAQNIPDPVLRDLHHVCKISG